MAHNTNRTATPLHREVRLVQPIDVCAHTCIHTHTHTHTHQHARTNTWTRSSKLSNRAVRRINPRRSHRLWRDGFRSNLVKSSSSLHHFIKTIRRRRVPSEKNASVHDFSISAGDGWPIFVSRTNNWTSEQAVSSRKKIVLRIKSNYFFKLKDLAIYVYR